ncbi:MAG: NAD(P)/FAD-dependent oxidoreductase [Chitinophagales bacterium]
MYDYLIIGQGLAGTWLSHFLLQKNKTVLVIDDAHPLAASRVSSGLMNPITGRKLVKSWKAEMLFPFARNHYRELEELLQARFCYDRTMVWLLSNVKELNTFWAKSGEVGYEKYFKNIQNKAFHPAFKNEVGFGEITGAMFVNTVHLIDSYRQYVQKNGWFIEAKLDYKDLVVNEKSVTWRGVEAGKVIFCEGHQSRFNPYFNWLPFVPAKGEFLIIEALNLDLEKREQIIKNKITLVPLSKDRYWVGSTYEWKELNETPTSKAQQELVIQLEKTLKIPYKILSHQAGIRPSAKDRRPFLGLHPQYSNVGIFNGLGTKGVSLSPYFAHHFAAYLEGEEALQKEVDIERYSKFCKE